MCFDTDFSFRTCIDLNTHSCVLILVLDFDVDTVFLFQFFNWSQIVAYSHISYFEPVATMRKKYLHSC